MAQVNSENSTTMPVVPTRRRFLSQAAGVAAGGTVLALATIQTAQVEAASAGAADPAFRIIAAHTKIAEAVLSAEAGMEERRGPVSEDEWDGIWRFMFGGNEPLS